MDEQKKIALLIFFGILTVVIISLVCAHQQTIKKIELEIEQTILQNKLLSR